MPSVLQARLCSSAFQSGERIPKLCQPRTFSPGSGFSNPLKRSVYKFRALALVAATFVRETRPSAGKHLWVIVPKGRLSVAQDVVLVRVQKRDSVPQGQLKIAPDLVLGCTGLSLDSAS